MMQERMPERMDDLRDRHERSVALDLARGIHCESPAGAGKTALLTGRFIKLLAEIEHPRQILALTFTNKAAGEMRQRIWNVFRMAEEGKREGINDLYPFITRALNRHRENLHLIYAPDGLRIMTFHSLCLAIVRNFPLEAHISPDATVIDGIEYEELIRQVTDETLLRIGALDRDDQRRHSLERLLLRTNNEWPLLRSDFIHLIARRDYLIDLVGLVGSYPDMESLKERLDDALETLITDIIQRTRNAILDTGLGKNWVNLSRCLAMIPGNPLSSHACCLPEARWSDLPAWQWIAEICTTGEGTARKRFSHGEEFRRCLKETGAGAWISALPSNICRMLHDLKALPAEGYDEREILAIYDLVILLGEIIDAWQKACRSRGVIDFVGLELACLRVFNNSEVPDIQLILDSSIHHILVDEFQDTSRNQWELLQRLCAGWSQGDGRTLFLVGDPKQSIYGFRKAEVSLFLEARKGLPLPGQGSLPLISITLKHNFRSRPGLVEWTNRIFGERIMANPREDVDEVPYSPAIASKEGEHRLSLAIFFESERVADPELSEAQWLARHAAGLEKELEEDERIGILLFTRIRMPLYLQAFRETGLPVMVAEGILLKERREVVSMHQMVRALVLPHDDLAHASLLRSPWLWCNPDILCRIARQPHQAWIDKMENYFTSEGDGGLQTWWEVVKRARMRVGRDPLFRIVKQAWLQMEGAGKCSQEFGSEGVANVMRYLEILEESEQTIPEKTLRKVEHALEKSYLPSPPEANRSRVMVMTVHRAKGLEFDYVYCPFLDWDPTGGGRAEQPPYLLEKIHGGKGILALRKDRREGTRDEIYKLLRSRAQEKRVAEAKRLFYVAVTRARKGLYLSGVCMVKDGVIRPRCAHAPLSHVIEHEGIRAWMPDPHDLHEGEKQGDSGLSILLNPSIAQVQSVGAALLPLPEPFPFVPESLPYREITPSHGKDDRMLPLQRGVSGKREDSEDERVRGVVIHAILAMLSRGEPLPSVRAVQGALYREGIGLGRSKEMAASILHEVELCTKEERCAWILKADHLEAYTELSVEEAQEGRIIRSGTIDRLIFDGRKWWIVDYKTAHLDMTDPDCSIQEQAALYLHQMKTYRGMVSRSKGVCADDINLLLYFTSIQRGFLYR